MSLLMDALKQAEHAKRDKRQETSASPTPSVRLSDPEPSQDSAFELSLSPVEPRAAAEDLGEELFDLHPAPAITQVETPAREANAPQPEPTPSSAAQPTSAPAVTAPDETAHASTAAPSAPPLTVSPMTGSAEAASRVLAASISRRTRQRRTRIFTSVALLVLLSTALLGYYYWASSQVELAAPVKLPDVPANWDSEQAAATPVTPAVNEPAAAPIELEIRTPPAQTAWQPGPPPQALESDWEPAPVDPRSVRGETPTQPLAGPMAETSSPPAIRISRGSSQESVGARLNDAYLAYQAGRYAEAGQAYRQVLAKEPHNRDARLGLAALAIRNGELETARAHYRAVLERDPHDPTVQAAMAGLQETPNAASESELKQLLANQPHSAALHFALANLYAGQARWALAQQAYFEAQRLAPQQPDYAFNLAVSLEHLEQRQAALNYYRRALSLATVQQAHFDIAAAERRVQALTAGASQ